MSSDDWARIKPTTVNINKLFENNPKHCNCDLAIATSNKNPTYRGLYCRPHKRWLTWINPEQEEFLNTLGIDDDDYFWNKQ